MPSKIKSFPMKFKKIQVLKSMFLSFRKDPNSILRKCKLNCWKVVMSPLKKGKKIESRSLKLKCSTFKMFEAKDEL